MKKYLFLVALYFIFSFNSNAEDLKKPIEIVNGFHGIESLVIGEEFKNRFSVPSRKEALYKVERLKNLKTPITVQQFLGNDIKFIRIIFFDSSFRDFSKARVFLENLTNINILMQSHRESPQLEIYWEEHTEACIKALVFFANGHIGRIESDGTHLFMEDAAGTYWWYRWEPSSSKKYASY